MSSERKEKKEKKEKSLSVIVPVYNAKDYLETCIDSVLGQSFRDLELILVDDGSTDGSGQICDEYARRDERVRVFHTENHGLVAARKKGLKESRGEFIGYVDADDWIEPDMYAYLYETAVRNSCDLVATGYYRQFSDHAVPMKNRLAEGFYDREAIEKQVIPKMLYNGVYFQNGVLVSLASKLIKRELLFKTQMDVPENITIGEDAAVTYPSILRAQALYLSDEIFYHYRQHDGSMCKTLSSEKDMDSLRALCEHMKRMLRVGHFKEQMTFPFNMYLSCMLLQRCIGAYDQDGRILSPFGGVEPGDRIVVYGAGNFGKQVHRYAAGRGMQIFWADKRASFYQEQGMDVLPIERLLDFEYDWVLLAIIDEETAKAARNGLVKLGVDARKIRWLDLEYLKSVDATDLLSY